MRVELLVEYGCQDQPGRGPGDSAGCVSKRGQSSAARVSAAGRPAVCAPKLSDTNQNKPRTPGVDGAAVNEAGAGWQRGAALAVHGAPLHHRHTCQCGSRSNELSWTLARLRLA
jgi:hypothetical protein